MSKPLHPIVTIAISGPSSSGKSTLSHLLSLLLPAPITTPIIHADDFYRPDSQLPLKPLPTTTEPVLDWDCPEALNFPAFISTLQHVKQHGVLPDAHKTYEDPSIAEKGVERVVGSGVVRELKEKYKGEIERFKETGGRVVMVDGFLLFGEGVPKELGVEFDVKLLLRASYEKVRFIFSLSLSLSLQFSFQFFEGDFSFCPFLFFFPFMMVTDEQLSRIGTC